MKKNNRTLKMIRNECFVILYVIALFALVTTVGSVSRITTYNIRGNNSIQSSHMVDKYVPKPTPEEIEKKKQEEARAYLLRDRQYRLTSFYANDELKTGDCTGSGLCSWDLVPNEYGWYTYNGKLVLAAATTYMINTFGYREDKVYFKYYDEVNVTIDGKVYPGIILDTCGACYRDQRLDLFVKDGKSAIDRGYMGRNMINVEITKKK